MDPDQEARLEEFKYFWKDFLEEQPGQCELMLAELELNRSCLRYLVKETRQLPLEQRPRSLILNSCKYHPTDGTANLMSKYFNDDLALTLKSVRLESAYVGHLPTPSATILLQGLQQVSVLESVQLVDIDLRPPTVAWQVPMLPRQCPQLQNLEMRHCRVDEPFLQALGSALFQEEDVYNIPYNHGNQKSQKQQAQQSNYSTKDNYHHYFYYESTHQHQQQQAKIRVTFHACVMDDHLLHVFCNALDTNNCSTLRQLSLPSNRFTHASIDTLATLLQNQPQLQHLDLQRTSRLFSTTTNLDHRSSIHNFTKALQSHGQLVQLDLTRCGVTNPVAEALLRALEHATCGVRDLNLSGNHELGLDDDGWMARLPHVAKLERLDLPKHSHNHASWYHEEETHEENHHHHHHHHHTKNKNLLYYVQQNTTLTALLHDGVPSAQAQSVLERNAWMKKARECGLWNFGRALWPRVLQVYANQAQAQSAFYHALQEALSENVAS